MFNYNKVYNDRLVEAWEKFIASESYDYSFIRPEILDSWKRSRSYLVDPYRSKTTILPPEELKSRIKSNRLLIEISRPYMEKLYSVVKGSGFYLLLIDKDGYILDLIGDKDIIDHGRIYSKLVVGANRSEQFAGTNAIGTGLELLKPIQIWGNEHYIKHHKDYSCSSSPIFNTEGELLGCLNITGRSTESHPHTLGMIISAVDGISNELKIRNACLEIEKVSNQRNRIIETMPSGLVLLNRDDQIIQANTTALSMLRIKNENIIGKDIFSVLHFDDNDNNEILTTQSYNKEMNLSLVDTPNVHLKFNVSIDSVFDSDGDRDGTVLRFNETKRIHKLVNQISGYKSSFTFDSIIGDSHIVRKMIQTCERAAKSDSNILILGESGTGKELVAQSIHNASRYASGPFVAINCGALPKGLVESELFGYEKGAFTGAKKDGNPGKFELADGGTIFLDEIGDMPLDVQVTLLRVLETREIVRIGGKYPKPIDVRVIAATNRDLTAAIEEKTFRDDLFYRLNVFTVEVPPLKDREEDIRLLTDYFVNSLCAPKGINKTVSEDVYSIFKHHHWPGNIRELENIIERAINISDETEIRPDHLPDYLLQTSADVNRTMQARSHRARENLNLESTGYQLMISSLEKSEGNIKKAAELLGISRRTLYRRLEKYDIDYDTFRK
ncbi:MAG TPA: sigma-54-dependent Fis family transcriptional regulator [Anaerovoracaceae bacterium]|nr:sigma-54-dependent Fis family transcriptional regulator [Anaerovoracaceae bacterium]